MYSQERQKLLRMQIFKVDVAARNKSLEKFCLVKTGLSEKIGRY